VSFLPGRPEHLQLCGSTISVSDVFLCVCIHISTNQNDSENTELTPSLTIFATFATTSKML